MDGILRILHIVGVEQLHSSLCAAHFCILIYGQGHILRHGIIGIAVYHHAASADHYP